MDLGENKNWAEQTALSFDAVEKAYGEFCLGPLSLKLPAGCVTGLVGENGAGKTTLMKLALGMAIPDSGTVSCLDFDPVREGKQARKDVGVVFGELQIPGNFTAQMAGDFWQGIYENFDRDYFKRLQERFAIPGSKPIRRFSAGMKAKLALAGAVSHHPRLLIAGRTVKQSRSFGEGESDGDVKRAWRGGDLDSDFPAIRWRIWKSWPIIWPFSTVETCSC